MAKIRLVAHIGVISFNEFLRKKAQAYVPGDPTELSPVEDLAIRNVFTPEQLAILNNPPSLRDLKRVIDEFPEVMNNAVNQINMLPKEQYLQGEYFLNNLLEYFDQIKFLYEALEDSVGMQQAVPEKDFVEEVEKAIPEKTEPGAEEMKEGLGEVAPHMKELLEPIDQIESNLNELTNLIDSFSEDDIAYSPSLFKRNVLTSLKNLVNQIDGLSPIIDTAFDAYA